MMTETDLSEAVINSSYAAIATNRALSNRVSEIRSAERHLANRIQQLKLDRQVLDERQSELDMFLSELKIPYELSLVARRLREFSPLLNGKEDLILKEIIQVRFKKVSESSCPLNKNYLLRQCRSLAGVRDLLSLGYSI